MGTFVYNPGVKVIIGTSKGTIDVSNDIVSGGVALRQNAPHAMNIRLTNYKRKYDGIFAPNDRFVVRLKRVKWVQVMSGHLNKVPYASVWPREVNLSGQCTLKKVMKRLYDPGAEATVALLNQYATQDNFASGDDAMIGRLKALLVDIGEWPEDRIHISALPPGWMDSIRSIYESISPLIASPAEIVSSLNQLVPGGAMAGAVPGSGPAPGASGDTYSRDELMALARWAGIQDTNTAAAIALAESSGNPNAENRANRNGSIDRGLWQINSIHGALSTFDPEGNARAMASISKGGTDWTPWVVYNTGAYRRFLGPSSLPATASGAPRGPANDPANPGSNSRVFPVPGRSIGSGFGMRLHPILGINRLHAGVDIGAPQGTPIVAAGAGRISLSTSSGGGNTLDITMADGTVLRHLHIMNNGYLVAQGATVTAGQPIAKVGSTGLSTAPHLHFEVRPGGGNPVDPAPWLAGAAMISTPEVGAGSSGLGSADGDLTTMMAAHLQGSQASGLLVGPRVLMNDVPLFNSVRDLFGAMMRSFCSAPNGDIIAWFPDYFGNYGQLGTMTIEPIELMDFTMDWDDNGLVTHQFVTGSFMGYAGQEIPGERLHKMVTTMGVATVEFPEILGSITGQADGWYDPDEILERYGARVDTHHAPAVTTPEAEFFLAVHLFALGWSAQFHTQVPISFMPELYPGMLLKIPHVGLQVYVKEVSHNWTMSDGGGFTTTVEIIAPSSLDGSMFDLPRAGHGGEGTGAGWLQRVKARLS